MTVTYDRQYRALAEVETAANDALTVRSFNELLTGVQNFKAAYGPKVLSESFPGYDVGADPPFSNPSNSTAENVVQVFADREVSLGYNLIHWQLAGRMHSSATGTTTWRLYIAQFCYRGPLIVDATLLGMHNLSTIVISSTTHVAPAAMTDLVLVHDSNHMIHMMITAQNSVSADEDYCMLSSLDATAKIEEAGI